MQRVTVTIDDDLLEEIDALCQRKGYQSRSEAMRDIVRAELTRASTSATTSAPADDEICNATLTYVYNHETRALASRLTTNHHHHSDMSISTTHVHLDHDNCLEVSILRGPVGKLQAFADSVISQRGVRHGALHIMPPEPAAPAKPHTHRHHDHDHGDAQAHGHHHRHDGDDEPHRH
jgi:CopG family nickel-responsive transcriptional regulator